MIDTPRYNLDLREKFEEMLEKEWSIVATYDLFDETDPLEEEEDGSKMTAIVYRSTDNEWSVAVEAYQPKKPVDKDSMRVIGVKRDKRSRSMVEYTVIVESEELERSVSQGLTPHMMNALIAQAKTDTGLL